MSALGARVKSRRLNMHMTLRQLAKIVGKSPTFISRLENGREHTVASETLASIAAALHDDLDALLLLANHVPPDIIEILKESPGLCNDIRALRNSAQHCRMYTDDEVAIIASVLDHLSKQRFIT